jgi:cysteine synthase A
MLFGRLAFRGRAAAACATASAAAATFATFCAAPPLNDAPGRPGVLSAIGNTPLVELPRLSEATGCRILAKCEFLNPGGSIKDRAALFMVEEAERQGLLGEGSTIYEGTGGNTGVGLAMVAAAKGYGAVMAMPGSIAKEKVEAMETYGAKTILTPSVPFTSMEHYFHRARDAARADPKGFWCNQFDNLANLKSHYLGTAPELWLQTQRQTGTKVDGFVCSCGTGGTLAGIAMFLKEQDPGIQCYLVDPHGSALFDYVKHKGRHFTETIVAGKVVKFIKRDGGSSMTEGIGIGRVTANFEQGALPRLDGQFKASDKEAIEMAYWLKENEGVYVGPSAALNVVGAVKLAKKMGPGHTIVTVLCDGGGRYKSKLYTQSWLKEKGFVLLSREVRDALEWLH